VQYDFCDRLTQAGNDADLHADFSTTQESVWHKAQVQGQSLLVLLVPTSNNR